VRFSIAGPRASVVNLPLRRFFDDPHHVFTRSVFPLFPHFSTVAAALLAVALATGCATRAPTDEEADVDEPASQGGTVGLAEGVTGTAGPRCPRRP
jgi:hypothetical protein